MENPEANKRPADFNESDLTAKRSKVDIPPFRGGGSNRGFGREMDHRGRRGLGRGFGRGVERGGGRGFRGSFHESRRGSFHESRRGSFYGSGRGFSRGGRRGGRGGGRGFGRGGVRGFGRGDESGYSNEEVALDQTSSEEDFPGYPDWSQNKLLLMLEHLCSISPNNYINWEQFCFPGSKPSCMMIWQKLQEEVRPSLKDSINFVKLKLMNVCPKDAIKLPDRPAAWPIQPRTSYAVDEYSKLKKSGETVKVMFIEFEERFRSLPVITRATYEEEYYSSIWKYYMENFNYFKHHPDQLSKVQWSISRRLSNV